MGMADPHGLRSLRPTLTPASLGRAASLDANWIHCSRA